MKILILLLLFLPGIVFAGEQKVLKLQVDHLLYESCSEKFRAELSSVCKNLTLDFKKGEAVCTYEDPVTPKKILSKAKKTGLPTKIAN